MSLSTLLTMIFAIGTIYGGLIFMIIFALFQQNKK